MFSEGVSKVLIFIGLAKRFFYACKLSVATAKLPSAEQEKQQGAEDETRYGVDGIVGIDIHGAEA